MYLGTVRFFVFAYNTQSPRSRHVSDADKVTKVLIRVVFVLGIPPALLLFVLGGPIPPPASSLFIKKQFLSPGNVEKEKWRLLGNGKLKDTCRPIHPLSPVYHSMRWWLPRNLSFTIFHNIFG